MSTAREVIQSEIAYLFAEFGETVNYNGTDITAVVEVSENWDNGNVFSSSGRSARRRIWVKDADVETVDPETIVQIGDERCQVAQVIESMEGLHYLEIIGMESPF